MRGPMRVEGRFVSAADEAERVGKKRREEAGELRWAVHVSQGRDHDAVSVLHWSDFAALRADKERWTGLVPMGERWQASPSTGGLWRLSGAVLRWGAMVHDLVARRKYLLETIAQISTLGGGWASVGARDKASQFAVQQRNVARMLGDETLELLSNVYIGYAHLYGGRRELAGKLIGEQTELAKRRGDKRQLLIVEAARLQLQRYDEAALSQP